MRWYREKFSKLDAQKGRNTGSALNPYKFCHVRSAEGMTPLQEVHSDGWSTKFYAPHPVSGKWVTGEVWHSHDVATRKAYVHERSIGLSESTTVIMGALYAVCAEDGEPLAEVLFDSMGMGGKIVMYGITGGRQVCFSLNIGVRNVELHSVSISTSPRFMPESMASFREIALPLFAQGVFKPVLDVVLPLAELKRAHQMLDERTHFGKIVMTV